MCDCCGQGVGLGLSQGSGEGLGQDLNQGFDALTKARDSAKALAKGMFVKHYSSEANHDGIIICQMWGISGHHSIT